MPAVFERSKPLRLMRRGKKASMSHIAVSHSSQGKSSFLCSARRQDALPQQLGRCFSFTVIGQIWGYGFNPLPESKPVQKM